MAMFFCLPKTSSSRLAYNCASEQTPKRIIYDVPGCAGKDRGRSSAIQQLVLLAHYGTVSRSARLICESVLDPHLRNARSNIEGDGSSMFIKVKDYWRG